MNNIYHSLKNNIFFYLIIICCINFFSINYLIRDVFSDLDRYLPLIIGSFIIAVWIHSFRSKIIMTFWSNKLFMIPLGVSLIIIGTLSIIDFFKLNNSLLFTFINFLRIFDIILFFLTIYIFMLYSLNVSEIREDKTFIMLKDCMKSPINITTDSVFFNYTVEDYKFTAKGWHIDNKIIRYQEIFRLMNDMGKSHIEKDDFKIMEMYFIN